jgi:peptidoglycan/LPS O-acetylase OafA/YrhL
MDADNPTTDLSRELPARPLEVDRVATSPDTRALPQAGGRHYYLGQFNSYRVIACCAVVFQHSLLWTLAPGNVFGWSFVMLLHFSRTAFFFLSAFLLTYAQITRPRSTIEFWRRRYVQLGVPYLAWSLIYWIYTLIDHNGSIGMDWSVLWHDVVYGYYQLYFIVVLFQLYFVYPVLLRVVQRTRHQGWLMAGSLLFALALSADLHWPGSFGAIGHATVWVEQYWPFSRDPITYQEQFIAGILVALHYERVHRFVDRWWRQFVALAVFIGVAATLWYLVAVWAGESTGFASNIYQPIAFLWFTAVVAALECCTYRWYKHRGDDRLTRFVRAHAPSLAALTGGIFLSHVLFINLLRTALGNDVLIHVGWFGRVLVLFGATISVSALFTAIVLRTPLRWILGGPVRAQQQERLELLDNPPELAAPSAYPLPAQVVGA